MLIANLVSSDAVKLYHIHILWICIELVRRTSAEENSIRQLAKKVVAEK
jgi:hypothetical protein